MFKNLNKLVLVPIASFVAAALLPSPVNADGGDYLLPVVASIGEFNIEQDDGKVRTEDLRECFLAGTGEDDVLVQVLENRLVGQ